jgi:transposase
MATREHATVELTAEERRTLMRMTRKGENKARVITRAQILLRLDKSQGKGESYAEIGGALKVYPSRISRVAQRYREGGLEKALSEDARPGKTPKLTGDVEARLITLACSKPPEGHVRWTLQMLADKLIAEQVVDTISDSAICDKLKKMKSSPGK